MVTPLAIVDLLSVLPFFLPFLLPDLRPMRLIRLLRLVRLLKIFRYDRSFRTLGRVLWGRRRELGLLSVVLFVIIVISSTLMYYAEHAVQPEVFSDIPSSMWWSVVTLTTVGYGDVYPKTGAGKLLASLIALLGIGLFALPSGLIAAGLIEEIQQQKESRAEAEKSRCPHCGGTLGSG